MTLGNSPQPLTRRQLRELAREQEPAVADAAGPEDAAPEETVPDQTVPDQTVPDHTVPEQTVPEDVASDETIAASQHSRHTTEPASVPAAAAPAAADPGRTLTRREFRALQIAASASAGDTEAAAEEPIAPAPVQAAAATPRSASRVELPVDDAPAAGLHPPVGHWSVDREDDTHQDGAHQDASHQGGTFEDLVGRGIGAGGIPTTTNALILPAIPRQGTAGPIMSTGEIMITGSLDLPRSLGATGQLPNLFDSSEMDRMLDQLDEGGHHNDVAPVSASRAVSTHTSTRGVMTPPRKRGASLPTVLAITAAVLAIGVLSLFVIGYAFHIY